MVRGRRQAKRETAHAREAEAHEAEERGRREEDERVEADRRLAKKWGRGAAALDHLSALSRELEKLHREEARLLHDRDELVHWLRHSGQSWTMLSARTKLSRQALAKRKWSIIEPLKSSHDARPTRGPVRGRQGV